MALKLLLPFLCLNLAIPRTASLTFTRSFIIFRHGHRNPLNLYPNHPLINSTPPEYYGQLTELGKAQATQLGERLREFYTSKMNGNRIRRTDVEVITSNTTRSLLSGSLFLRAFLQGPGNPLQTIPHNKDYEISQFAPCKDYEAEFFNIMTNTPLFYRALMYLHRTDLATLQQSSGLVLDSIKHVANLYDTIYCEKMAGHDLPEWSSQVYPEGLRAIASASLKMVTGTPYMLKEKSGPLLHEINSFMDDENDASPKFRIFSGHDTTLMSLARALRIDRQLPKIFNFTATLAFELYTGNTRDEDVVKVRFFDLDGEQYEVVPADCSSWTECSKKEFLEVTNGLSVKDVKQFCNNQPDTQHSEQFLRILISQYVDTSVWNSGFPGTWEDLGLSVISHLPEFLKSALKEFFSK